MKLIVASLFAVALAVPAWGQEKDAAGAKQEEKKAPAKDGGDPVKKPAADGGGEPVKKVVKEAGEGPTLGVEEVDVNGDGRISAAELKAAMGKLGGYYAPKKEGVKDGAPVKKEGAPVEKKDAPKDGTKEPSKDGGDAKKAPAKDSQK
jgi:hypothetical protein